MSTKSDNSRLLLPSAILLACLAAYAGTLTLRGFIYDDRGLIGGNPLLGQGLRAIPRLLSTGYWEAIEGSAAKVQEYRPVLMLSFLLQTATTGLAAPPMHAVNLLLHMAVCLALWRLLKLKMAPAAAGAAALVYAVMPVHTEAVTMLTGRSELLSAAFILASWLCLDENDGAPRLGAGVALYVCALLTKESSILLPVLLALNDWVFGGETPWPPHRRRVQALLWGASGGYFLLRLAFLSRAIHGGAPYFGSGRLVAALTLSRFWLAHYLWPSLSGAGLCTDYSRPLIPDASPYSLVSWVCLAAVAAAFGAAAVSLLRDRRPWAFWILGPCLFLLPTSHLIFPLDSIGAQRFLYMPTIGLAVGLGHLYARLKNRRRLPALLAAAVLIGWYAGTAWRRNRIWRSQHDFFAAAVSCNPVSAKSWGALGASLLERGEIEAGKAHLARAMRMDPRRTSPYYNLARLAWEQHDAPEAERLIREALRLRPDSPDALSLLALACESQGRMDEALALLKKTLVIRPLDPMAEFNLGRHFLLRRKPELAAPHFARFLELAPDDPDAARVERLLGEIAPKREAPTHGD